MTLKAALEAVQIAMQEIEDWSTREGPNHPTAFRVLIGQAREKIAQADDLIGYVALDTGDLTGERGAQPRDRSRR